MSSIPTPVGLTRPASRLPITAPIATAEPSNGTSMMKPPVFGAGTTTNFKRPRGDSTDLEDGMNAKRQKESLMRSKSGFIERFCLNSVRRLPFRFFL